MPDPIGDVCFDPRAVDPAGLHAGQEGIELIGLSEIAVEFTQVQEAVIAVRQRFESHLHVSLRGREVTGPAQRIRDDEKR